MQSQSYLCGGRPLCKNWRGQIERCTQARRPIENVHTPIFPLECVFLFDYTPMTRPSMLSTGPPL
jgi:hypothetical protein